MVTILRDAGLSELIESETVEQLAGGFQFTEGPLWQPDGSLLFQDIKAERTYRLEPGPFGALAPRADGRRQRPDFRRGRFHRLLRTDGPPGFAAVVSATARSSRSSKPGRARGSTAPTTLSAGPTA